jgi:hypothetical protein
MINAALPTSVLFDRTGHAVRIFVDYGNTSALRQSIASLIPTS